VLHFGWEDAGWGTPAGLANRLFQRPPGKNKKIIKIFLIFLVFMENYGIMH